MLDVHYFAAARAAAGASHERLDNPPATLGELVDHLADTHAGTTDAGMGLADIVKRCSFLLDGANAETVVGRAASLAGVSRVDILPPFAGG